jgi:hypothetical protein
MDRWSLALVNGKKFFVGRHDLNDLRVVMVGVIVTVIMFAAVVAHLHYPLFFYKKLRRKVTVGGVSMFVVAG